MFLCGLKVSKCLVLPHSANNALFEPSSSLSILQQILKWLLPKIASCHCSDWWRFLIWSNVIYGPSCCPTSHCSCTKNEWAVSNWGVEGEEVGRLQKGKRILMPLPLLKSPTAQWVSLDLHQHFSRCKSEKRKGAEAQKRGDRIWRRASQLLQPPQAQSVPLVFAATCSSRSRKVCQWMGSEMAPDSVFLSWGSACWEIREWETTDEKYGAGKIQRLGK